MGIGALRTEDVIDLARDAKEAGADAGLLAPVSYQPLTEDEVFALFETVARAVPGGWVAWGDAEECLALTFVSPGSGLTLGLACSANLTPYSICAVPEYTTEG